MLNMIRPELSIRPDPRRVVARPFIPGFVGTLDAQNARERLSGIKEVLKGSNVEIIDTRTDDTDRVRAKANVLDTLVKYPDVACVGDGAGPELDRGNVALSDRPGTHDEFQRPIPLPGRVGNDRRIA